VVDRMRCEVMHRLEGVEAGPETDIRLIDLVWRAGGLGSGLARRPGAPEGNTAVDYSIIFGRRFRRTRTPEPRSTKVGGTGVWLETGL
jgi:hypothetical protein